MQNYYELKTPRGIMRGFFHQPISQKYPVCLIFHGFTGCCTGTKFSYVQLARKLEASDIGTIRLDFLGSGESDLNFRDMTFKDELECAEILLEEVMKMKNIQGVYLLGHSMGGALASELAKKYPHQIQKLCLWAPALNLPEAIEYLTGQVEQADEYDHNGFMISDDFVKDICQRDFYQGLDIYQNALMIIHGNQDRTVPYEISNQYLPRFHQPIFHCIQDGTHNFDNIKHIQEVIDYSYQFLISE